MSLSDRRKVLALGAVLAAAGALSGCFRPMLAADSPSADLRGRITLPEIDDRIGYFLFQSLEDRLGRTTQDDWNLTVDLETKERGLAVANDNAVTRISVTATARWALYRKGEAEPVLREKSVTQSGYNSTEALFATRQTRLDIERRLAEDLGERISRAILARARTITGAS